MSGATDVQRLDLADLRSIRAFAAHWTGDLDILVNNAGIMQVPHSFTKDGCELQMGTNYLGPVALTVALLPHVRSRAVTVSSQLQSAGHIHLEDLNGAHREYNALQAYRDSKLANTLFTLELSRRLAEAGKPVRVITSDPGFARTGLAAHIGGPSGALQKLAVRMFNEPARGAATALYAATADIPSGSYVGPDGFRHLRGSPKVIEPPRAARDAELARQLWDLTTQLTAQVPLRRALCTGNPGSTGR